VARLRAWCQLGAGRAAEAVRLFEQFERDFPNSLERGANRVDWGRALAEAGRLDEAVAVLEPAAAARDTDAGRDALLRLARVRAQQGHPEQATALFLGLATNEAARADRRAEAWLALAEAQAAQTNWTAAVGAVSNGLALAPTPTLRNRARAELGRLRVRQGEFDEGAALLKGVVVAAPDDPAASELQLELAAFCLGAGRHEQAAEEYQYYGETFTNRLGRAQAFRGRGAALFRLQRYAESAATYEKAYTLFEDAVEREACLVRAGDASFANAQYKLAAETYGRARKEFGDTALGPQVRYQEAECRSRLGEPGPAEQGFRELVALHPDSPFAERALFRLAELREEAGRVEEAIAGYEQVMSVYTNGALYPEALHRRGLARYQLFQFAEGLKDFGRVVHEFPKSRIAPQADYMRGWSLFMLGRDEEALAICRASVEKHPQTEWTPGVVFWLGEYAYNHGLAAEAAQQFLLLADRYTADALADDALLWAGRALVRQKEYLKAVECFTRLAKAYPESPKLAEARFFQGEALSELGEFPSAILLFEELIAKFPDHYLVAAAWMRKGDCQFTLGADDSKRFEEAMESYQAVLKRADAPFESRLQAEYKIGRCLDMLKRFPEALERYHARVIVPYLEGQLSEGHAGAAVWFTKAAFAAADILEADKRWREAVRMLERVIEAGVPSAGDARARIEKIRSGHWMLFY
jgi:tetratricopeptide (TPR) repeat protein